MLVGAVVIYNLQNPLVPKSTAVAIDFIQEPVKTDKVAKVRKTQDVLRNQVVEQEEKPNKNEPPPDTRFLSAQNQKVIKQTVAKNRGDFKNAAKEQNKKSGEKGKKTLQDLSTQFDPYAIKEKQQADANGDQGTFAKGGDVSQSNDYLKDIQTGEQTVLNSREFKYYTYYSRIRRQLSQHWEPKVREKLTKIFRQGRRIASDQDHITKLMIFLNDKGQLVKVQVLGESGVRDLDEAATEAFKSAAPFPNPPRGIIENDGLVKIRWDFVLES
jgi:protein TonB